MDDVRFVLTKQERLRLWRESVNTKPHRVRSVSHRARCVSKGNNERTLLTRRTLLTFFPPEQYVLFSFVTTPMKGMIFNFFQGITLIGNS